MDIFMLISCIELSDYGEKSLPMYMKPDEAFKRLDAAAILKQNIYIFGATGYGKTELIKQYFGNRKYTYLKCTLQSCDLSEVLKFSGKSLAVVIDDLQYLQNEEVRNNIIECCRKKNLWMIFVSRGNIPRWLFEVSVENQFMIIGEELLSVSKDKIVDCLDENGLQLTQGELENFCIMNQGNPFSIMSCIMSLKNGAHYDDNLIDSIALRFFEHLEDNVLNEWPTEIADFIIKMGMVQNFNEQLASMMTGSTNVFELIQRAREIGNFLIKDGKNYTIIDKFMPALEMALNKRFSQNEIHECALMAGRYYEMEGEELKALSIYKQYKESELIKNLLIRNSRKTPDTGFYFEMRKYYYYLDEDTIRENIYLMSGMSLLEAIMLNPDKSEYWYEELRKYKDRVSGAKQREAERQLAYLDIALPNRGSINVLSLIKSYFTLFKDKSIPFPEFSVTSNQPSLMNGGKDFCEWSKHDRQLAATVGKTISTFLGKYGKGLVGTALAESFFEKGEDLKEVSSQLSRATVEMSGDSKIQMRFALLGIKMRYYIAMGETEYAKKIIDSFVKEENPYEAKGLIQNVIASRCRIALFEGDKQTIEEYLSKAPNEEAYFYTMNRYAYLTKVRCYIMKEEYTKAISLLDSLLYYAQINDRPYIRMEIGILRAIIRFRENAEWQEDFLTVLEELCSYHFVRVITEECGAAYELLNKISDMALSDEKIDKNWFRKVLDETGKMARKYKLYLKKEETLKVDISPFDVRILACLADGFSVHDTADKLKINYETLRSRIKEIYRKLNAKNKTDAVMIAQSMGLI